MLFLRGYDRIRERRNFVDVYVRVIVEILRVGVLELEGKSLGED